MDVFVSHCKRSLSIPQKTIPLCEALVRGRKVCIFTSSLVNCVEQLKKKANIVTKKVEILSANCFEIEDDDVFLMCCAEKQSFQLQIDSIDTVQGDVLAEVNPRRNFGLRTCPEFRFFPGIDGDYL